MPRPRWCLELNRQMRAALSMAIEMLTNASIQEIQERGYHFQKRDYYSALNDLSFLTANWDLWHDRPMPRGVDWDLDAQLNLVRRISQYFPELAEVPMDAPLAHRAITGTTTSGVEQMP